VTEKVGQRQNRFTQKHKLKIPSLNSVNSLLIERYFPNNSSTMVRTVHFNKSNNNDDNDDDDDDDAPSRGRTRSRRHDLHDQNIMFEGVVDGTTHHLNGEDEGLGVDGGSGVVGEESSFNRSDIVVAGKRRRSITPHPNHHRHRHVHQHQKKKTTTAMIRRHNHHHGRTESSGDENEDEGKHYQYDVMMDEEVDIENSDIYESVDEDVRIFFTFCWFD
jgi:hypothetical protein